MAKFDFKENELKLRGSTGRATVRMRMSANWEELEKQFDKQAKRAPALMKQSMQKPLTLIKGAVKKNIPDRGRGWKKKFGQESGLFKKFIDKHVRVNRKIGRIWGGVGVRAGVVQNVKRTLPNGKVVFRNHSPWKIDHLIEFGFYNKRHKKWIPGHPFLRKARAEKGQEAIALLGRETSRLINKEFQKRNKGTRAPFRSS